MCRIKDPYLKLKCDMKLILISLLVLIPFSSFSQEAIKDTRSQLEKEDSNKEYGQEKITTLDLLEALDLASIRIHKFALGEFDKEYKLRIIADKYYQGKIVNTDTLLDYNNLYSYWVDGKHYPGYIDQIKFFSKTEDNQAELMLKTYAVSTKKEIDLTREDERQFFLWREFEKTPWKVDKKVPLLVFASSWLDKKNDVHRFCGVVKLNEGEKETMELLSSSPNYIIISYQVSE
jgi:hypothetical protein